VRQSNTKAGYHQTGCPYFLSGVDKGFLPGPVVGLIYGSIERRVERLIDALRLSRASGVAIENLAGDDVEKLAAPLPNSAPEAPGEEVITIRFSGSVAHRVIRCAIDTGPSRQHWSLAVRLGNNRHARRDVSQVAAAHIGLSNPSVCRRHCPVI
jgi:hypothetical protein